MTGQLESLLNEIESPSSEGVFNVRRLEPGSVFYGGRDARGFAAILIETSDIGRTVPLKLAGIEASFSAPYRIVEEGAPPATQTLTSIVCTNDARDVVAYFANVMESLLPFLGRNPSAQKVAETVRELVELFQKLRRPARRPLVGLVGELNIIEAACDVAAAVRCWRTDPEERFDFAVGALRLDVKSSSNRQRVHEISFDQANPPGGTRGLIASIWIEQLAGGVSLSDLLRMIEEKIAGRADEILRLRTLVGATLGDSLPEAMRWCFDRAVASSSLRYFDAAQIPAIRPPLPTDVLSARFVSDLSRCRAVDATALQCTLSSEELGLLAAQS